MKDSPLITLDMVVSMSLSLCLSASFLSLSSNACFSNFFSIAAIATWDAVEYVEQIDMF
jgi:hypothetical protein